MISISYYISASVLFIVRNFAIICFFDSKLRYIFLSWNLITLNSALYFPYKIYIKNIQYF